VVGPFLGAMAGIYIILLSLLFGISWEQAGRMVRERAPHAVSAKTANGLWLGAYSS
jgi:hypothetical protein